MSKGAPGRSGTDCEGLLVDETDPVASAVERVLDDDALGGS
ncbi:hypothetical protein [Rathayibacter caricis]|nr:hypothetical protein [Rathayibacter caricis]